MQVETHSRDKDLLRLTFTFHQEELTLEYTLLGVIVYLKGYPTLSEPGSPALPQCPVRVALPPHTNVTRIEATVQNAISVLDADTPVAPQQYLRPGQPHEEERPVYHRPEEAQRHEQREELLQREKRPFVEPFAIPPFVPPSQQLYIEAIRRPPAQWIETTMEGLTPVASIQLHPVRLTTEGTLEFTPHIELTIHYEPDQDVRRQPNENTILSSRAQAMRQIALTRLTVVNPYQVFDFSNLYPILFAGTDYLIITDNQRWNAQTMVPQGAVSGDMVTSFERLATWKRQRGLRARVVTVTDIVAGVYGDFRTGSRDIQEVIRNFLKKAHSRWGVAWVLLGGDTDIVPIRRVASDLLGGVDRQSTNPPPENTSFWTGTHLRIHAVNLGDWWGASTTNLLVRRDNGLLIQYDAMGTSNATTRGWYFTTDETYATRSSTPTSFVRVNGPASEIDADLRFLYEWNTIPTDLYYSSLVGPQYNLPGLHDWDLTGNSVYGQHGDSNLDGINFTPAVSLGRASVSNAAQADAFVNKVIAYEKFQRPDGTALDTNWTKRVVLVSENWDSTWGGLIRFWATTSDPPGNNQYLHTAGAYHSLIKLKDTPNWNWSLLASISETDLRVIPYRTDAGPGVRGWYFARSNSNLSVSSVPVILPGGKIKHLLTPSQWIVVYGAPEELTPAYYLFNALGLDGSLADQEELRLQLQSEMPGFSDIRRLYQDIVDMSPSQVAAGPLEQLSAAGLRSALNNGPHIVSLSGHGSSYGCCELSVYLADYLTNGYHSFIVYADSCLTNQVDGNAVSEHLISNPNGGAVGYIGNTRFSWVGVGDDYQRRFFNQWSTLGGNAHLGLLNDTRASLCGSNNAYYRWVMLTLSLTGDPEMPLWLREPLKFRIPEVYLFDKLKLLVDPPPPEPPFPIELPYRKNWGLTYIHLRQGRQEETLLADSNGNAEIALTNYRSGPATLTVTRAGHEPVVQHVVIRKRQTKRGKNALPTAALLGGIAFGIALFVVLGGSKKANEDN